MKQLFLNLLAQSIHAYSEPIRAQLLLEPEWARCHRGREGERNNCVSKIQLVGKKYRDKTT